MDKMREEFEALQSQERHSNYAETRYWCQQYKQFAARLLEARQSAGQECGEAVALNGITLEQIAAAREVALAATEGPWEWGSSPCPDNETAKRICAENIDATKEPIGEFFEVFTPDGRRTSLVGNGPTSEANARHIAYFAPNNVLVMLDALESAVAAPTAAQSRIAELEAQLANWQRAYATETGKRESVEAQLTESRERGALALSKLRAAAHPSVNPRAAKYLIAEAEAALAAEKEQK